MITSYQKGRTTFSQVYLLIAALAFAFTCYYACARVWDVDEGWTYVSVRTESFPDLLAYTHFNIANNHLLNSIWFRSMQIAGCRNVIFYRGLSLLCFFPYAWFLYRIITLKATGRAAIWLALFFLPPVIVYFAAGRGYALAITAFCAALYYLQTCLDNDKASDYWRFFFCGVISSLAIVSFFYPFAAMLLYLYAVKFRSRLFTTRSIITAVLFLALTAYVYHVGKTILLHDLIINGTDNLFANGMYSTFFGTLSLNDLVFPWPDWYTRLRLEMISKVLIVVTFLPVAVILFRKYFRQTAALPVMVITTLFFLLSHLLLKAKYPSDRSALYLLYLIYIPVILVIGLTGNKFFKLHYWLAFAFSAFNLVCYIYQANRTNIYSALAQKPPAQYTVYSDWPNFADDVYSSLYFDGRITFHYLAKSFETNLPAVDERVKAALTDPKADLILLQQFEFDRTKQLFTTGFTIQPVLTSGFKQLYLIQRNPR
jgi:hypothetical protein